MKREGFIPLLLLIAICATGILIMAFSSYTATEGSAEVKGGSGTVTDPLQIEVVGNAGLLTFLDSLLLFRGIPAIDLYYSGERFYIPDANSFFAGKQPLAALIYLCLLVIAGILVILFILRLFGKRVTIKNVRVRNAVRTIYYPILRLHPLL